MKVQQKLLFFFIVILGVNSAQSQGLTFGVSVNLGLSKVTSSYVELIDEDPQVNQVILIGGDYDVIFTVLGSFGIFIEHKLGRNQILNTRAYWLNVVGEKYLVIEP